MTDREKLIELLDEATVDMATYSSDGELVSTFPINVVEHGCAEILADYLIAHGVTVQQWIPVSERLPDVHTLVLVVIKHVAGGSIWATTVGFCEYDALTKTFDANIGEIITHWMPLPDKPKEIE